MPEMKSSVSASVSVSKTRIQKNREKVHRFLKHLPDAWFLNARHPSLYEAGGRLLPFESIRLFNPLDPQLPCQYNHTTKACSWIHDPTGPFVFHIFRGRVGEREHSETTEFAEECSVPSKRNSVNRGTRRICGCWIRDPVCQSIPMLFGSR